MHAKFFWFAWVFYDYRNVPAIWYFIFSHWLSKQGYRYPILHVTFWMPIIYPSITVSKSRWTWLLILKDETFIQLFHTWIWNTTSTFRLVIRLHRRACTMLEAGYDISNCDCYIAWRASITWYWIFFSSKFPFNHVFDHESCLPVVTERIIWVIETLHLDAM